MGPAAEEGEAQEFMDQGGAWELIDYHTHMRREGRLTQAEGRKLGRRIKADRIERAR